MRRAGRIPKSTMQIDGKSQAHQAAGKKGPIMFDPRVMLMFVNAESLHPFSHAKAFNFWHVIEAPKATPNRAWEWFAIVPWVHSNELFFYAPVSSCTIKVKPGVGS